MAGQTTTAVIKPSVVQNGRMFLGTFDDSVSRSPWGFLDTDASNLTNTLIYHALLGPRLCARVGNILYHQPYFEALTGHSTPLLEMAASGFFQFHMKGDSFNDTIERRQAERTNSTLAWIQETGWARGTQLHRVLGDIQQRAGSQGVRQYSPSFHVLFQTLADRAIIEGTPEYRQIHAVWTQQFRDRNRTRSEFEKLCDATFGPGTASKNAAMSTINSVNHYAYALAMHEITERSGETPIVETHELLSFNRLTKSLVDSGRPLNAEHLESLSEGQVFEVIHRNLRVPVDIFHRPEHWSKLATLAATTDESDDFFVLKSKVILEIGRALEGGPTWKGPLELEKAAREYSRKLRADLGTRSSKLGAVFVNVIVDKLGAAGIKDALAGSAKDYAVTGLAGAAGFAANGTTGALAGLALGPVANVMIDLIADPTVYRARRIVDRIRYGPAERTMSSKEYSQRFVAPVQSALCIKQITPQAITAVKNDRVVAYLDDGPSDLF